MTERTKKEVNSARWYFVTFLLGMLVGSILPTPSAHAENVPLYDHTIVDSGSIQNGDTLIPMGMSNWKQINDQFDVAGINHVNIACGGCVVGTWASGNDFGPKGQRLWIDVPVTANVVWVNPVNRASGSLDEYTTRTTADTIRLLELIAARLPNVREVWLTGLHGEPFAPLNSKQPDDFAFMSGVIADRVADNPPAGLPFVVRHAAYIYAGTSPRADGLFWEQSDFRDDMLHLSSSGNKKAAALLETYALNALGASPPPDDPPPDPPTLCEPITPQTQCRLEDGDTICHCRFPDTWVVIDDAPPPVDPPATGGVCEPDPAFGDQQCSSTRNPGFCTCKNPWRKTAL